MKQADQANKLMTGRRVNNVRPIHTPRNSLRRPAPQFAQISITDKLTGKFRPVGIDEALDAVKDR